MKEQLPSNIKRSEVKVSCTFSFDSAHFLENYPGICANMHGHTYKLDVEAKGFVDDNGFVIDFLVLDKIVRENVIAPLDHKIINDVLDFNPTAENMVLWMFSKLNTPLKKYNCKLTKLTLWESPIYSATYEEN